MSFNPKDVFKETFRKSIMFFITLSLIVIGNEFIQYKFESGMYIFGLTLFASLMLGLSFLPKFINEVKDIYISYTSFKKYAPKVQEIDEVLGDIKKMKDEQITETITKLVDKGQI